MNDCFFELVGENIWTIKFPFKLIGANFGNTMTVIRYDNNKLLLHSPIPISPLLIQQLDSMGEVTLLVAPNLMHNLFINEWKQHYASATILAPRHIKKVNFDVSLEAITRHKKNSIELSTDFLFHFVAGMKGLHEYILFHQPSRTLVLTDLAFNIHTTKYIWSNIFFRLYGAYGKFGPTHLVKFIIKDKNKFSESIETILNYDFDKIVVSHGEVVKENGKIIFSEAFSQIK